MTLDALFEAMQLWWVDHGDRPTRLRVHPSDLRAALAPHEGQALALAAIDQAVFEGVTPTFMGMRVEFADWPGRWSVGSE